MASIIPLWFKIQIVIDTNGFISALKNNTGASFFLLTLIEKNDFETNLSVPLLLEYEAVPGGI